MNEWLQSSKYKDVWRFSDALIAELVRPELRKLQEMIDNFVLQNQERSSTAALAFTQDGLIYKHSRMSIQPAGASWRPGLAFSLMDDFARYKKQADTLSEEKAVMRQVLALLCYETHDLQELRDATPECLVRFVPEFANVPRYLNELVHIKSNERLVRQFKKIEPLFQLHAASHLLY